MKSLVVGGAGFVGAYLMRHLRDALRHKVTVTKLPHVQKKEVGVKFVDLDILNQNDIEKVLRDENPDCIFHLAAQSSVAVSWKNPSLTIDINIKGAVNLLEAIRAVQSDCGKKPRVLLIGSGEEYGHIHENDIPINEKTSTKPGNIYAATKACQNMIGKIYADAYGIDVMMVRAFNHIGPNQSPVFVVSDFCRQVAQIEKGLCEPVIKVGNLNAKRDFTDVRDVVAAYCILIEKGERGETYNVGSGHAVAISEILKMIVSQSKSQIKIEVDSAKLRPVDVPIIEADTTKLVKCTGWKQTISLEQTIRETLDFWRANV